MAKYIEYEIDCGKYEGKKIKIPQEELDRYMNIPSVKTQDDAIWVYLEDNGYIENEEQDELDQKAKENKITAKIHKAKNENQTTKRKVERKPDETKESIITLLYETLKDRVENTQITNVGKIVEFDLKGEHYKLDLIRQRKPKK